MCVRSTADETEQGGDRVVPIIPNALERFVFVRLGRGPLPILEIAGAGGLRVAAAAYRLGVLDRIADDGSTIDALGREMSADAGVLGDLLEALVAYGYLRRRGEVYRRTAVADRWLLRRSPADLGPFLDLWDRVTLRRWDELDEILRTGRPRRTLYEWLDENPEHWPLAQAAFRAVARIDADEVARRIRLPIGASRAIDVGGGHGLYAVALCRRYPALRATVFDTPKALAPARETLREGGMDERVELREGDALRNDLGGPYDAALLFNVVHGLQPDELATILGRIRAALAPGGRIFVLDQLSDARTVGPATRGMHALLGLTYRIVLGGRLWSYAEVASSLAAAGFADARRIRTSTSDLVEATVRRGPDRAP